MEIFAKNNCWSNIPLWLPLIVEVGKKANVDNVDQLCLVPYFKLHFFFGVPYTLLNHHTAWKIQGQWFNGLYGTQHLEMKLKKSDKTFVYEPV